MISKLIALQLKQDTRKRKQKDIVSYILPTIFLLVSFAVLVISLYYSSKAFAKLRFGEEYNIVTIFIVIVIMSVSSTLEIVKKVYLNDYNKILLKLPIKKMEIYLSSIVSIVIKQYILCILFLFFTSGIFGIVDKVDSIYYFNLFIISIFVTLFALGVGGILSIPMTYVLTFLKQHNIIRLITIVLLVGAFFYFYIEFMNGLINILNATTQKSYIEPSIVNSIKEVANSYTFTKLFTNILFSHDLALSYGVIAPVSIALFALSIILAKLLYYRMQSISIESTPKRANGINTSSPIKALIKREYLMIVRNESESLGIILSVCSMPLMVYMTTKMVAAAAETSIGLDIVFGVCVLTLSIFVVMGNSTAASSISRDGGASFLMDIIPFSKTKQILIKVLANSLISIVPFIISLILLVSYRYIDVAEFFVLFFALLIFIISYTYMAVIHDAKHPEFSAYSNKDRGGQNVLLSTLIGLVIAVVLGIGSIFLPQVLSNEGITFALIYVVVIIYALLVFLIDYKYMWGKRK